MPEDRSDPPSLLALSSKVTAACYGAILLIGLAGLVLVVQKPVATTEDLVNSTYSSACSSRLARQASEELKGLFDANRADISWPYQEFAEQFSTGSDAATRERAIARYLNERTAERIRHILLLLQSPAVAAILRDDVESNMAAGETVTVPILQSRIASGDFALGVAVLFAALHLYMMSHREYLTVARRKGAQSLLFVNPSLLTADRLDLDRLPRSRQKPYAVLQWGILFCSPLALLAILWWHYQKVGGAVATHSRVVVAMIIVGAEALFVWKVWFRAEEHPDVSLFAKPKPKAVRMAEQKHDVAVGSDVSALAEISKGAADTQRAGAPGAQSGRG